MKAAVVCTLAVLVALANAGEIKKDRGVLVLEKDNFQEAITSNKHILVEFCEFAFIAC